MSIVRSRGTWLVLLTMVCASWFGLAALARAGLGTTGRNARRRQTMTRALLSTVCTLAILAVCALMVLVSPGVSAAASPAAGAASSMGGTGLLFDEH